jgi:phosphinothricin acetyltransferase
MEPAPLLCSPREVDAGLALLLSERPPEDGPDVEAALVGAVEDVKEAPPSIGHPEPALQEGYRDPDPPARPVGRLADPPKRDFSVDERADPVSGTDRVARRPGIGNVEPFQGHQGSPLEAVGNLITATQRTWRARGRQDNLAPFDPVKMGNRFEGWAEGMSEAVMIRVAAPEDLGPLTEIYNHYVRETATTFDMEPFSPNERKDWFDQFAPTGRYRLLVAEESERVIGYASSSRFRPKAAYGPSVETTVYLSPDATGRGIGSRLYAALFDSIRAEDIHRALAGVTLPNPASIALHRRFGFRSIGLFHEVGRKMNRYWDVEWFEKPLR